MAPPPACSRGDSPPTSLHVPAVDYTPPPEVGGDFLGFQLLAELGRGSFGRVFLGRQQDLSDRLVALKVSSEVITEGRQLARLQHTNIVPVHSVHRAGLLQAVCMPYFGSATLADVLRGLGQRPTLPASGSGLVSTLEECRCRTRAEIVRAPSADAPRDTPEPSAGLRRLSERTHVEAVLWIGAGLADGLAHAHGRGIVHRDVKPANVLLADDGTPMLLDFNLAGDVKRDGGRVGGTLSYMAPEHLAAFAGMRLNGCEAIVDHRSDVFALGVILFELLTGHHPFPRRSDGFEQLILSMITDRTGTPPRLRSYNRALTPAVESIVRHCLHPDPARRYQSAEQLRDDLLGHLEHQALRHAPEPSNLERARKWARRHPRLTSFSTALILCGLLIVLLTVALVSRASRLAAYEARAVHAAFRDELAAARLHLTARLPDDPDRPVAMRRAQRALAVYDPLSDGWRKRPNVRHLPDDERRALPAEVGELLLLLATEDEEGLRLNDAALACFGATAPVALWEQRARLRHRLGLNLDEAARPPHGPNDRFLLARELAARGQHERAVGELSALLDEQPGHFAGWYLLGSCYLDLGQDGDAAACFTAAVALRPRLHAAIHNRGLARLRQGRYPQAEADLDHALRLRRDHPETLVLRARCREARGKVREALADLELAPERVRVLLMRARLHAALGEEAKARASREAALTATPVTEEDWIARGVARVETEPRGALEDFAHALKLAPSSLAARQNRAHVLSEHLSRPRDAIRALDDLLALRPGDAAARAGRAVLHARLGDAAAARRDIRLALAEEPASGELLYQAACAEARHDPRAAVAYLGRALGHGFGHGLLDTDDDFAPLRDDPGFVALANAARAIRAAGGRP